MLFKAIKDILFSLMEYKTQLIVSATEFAAGKKAPVLSNSIRDISFIFLEINIKTLNIQIKIQTSGFFRGTFINR